MINTVQRLPVTASMIVLKVAPTSVLVDTVKVVAGQNVADLTVLRLSVLDEAAHVSVAHVLKVSLHVGEAGKR